MAWGASSTAPGCLGSLSPPGISVSKVQFTLAKPSSRIHVNNPPSQPQPPPAALTARTEGEELNQQLCRCTHKGIRPQIKDNRASSLSHFISSPMKPAPTWLFPTHQGPTKPGRAVSSAKALSLPPSSNRWETSNTRGKGEALVMGTAEAAPVMSCQVGDKGPLGSGWGCGGVL